MNLFIDSTQREFVAALYDEKFEIIKYKILDTKYKVEEILFFFNDIEESINKIKNIYINLGPGSFMGSRIALLYVRTISQLKKINIYTTNTFRLIDIKGANTKKCIFATKTKSYCLINFEIELTEKSKNEICLDYKKIVSNFFKYLDRFDLTLTDILKPIYVSNPQIGKIQGNF